MIVQPKCFILVFISRSPFKKLHRKLQKENIQWVCFCVCKPVILKYFPLVVFFNDIPYYVINLLAYPFLYKPELMVFSNHPLFVFLSLSDDSLQFKRCHQK